jgi:uncharacterized protein YndB with AHSA1/START domain
MIVGEDIFVKLLVEKFLETARFEALPGNRTKLTAQSVFQSVTDRDGMLQSGMEGGVNDSYDRLDELLEKMKERP